MKASPSPTIPQSPGISLHQGLQGVVNGHPLTAKGPKKDTPTGGSWYIKVKTEILGPADNKVQSCLFCRVMSHFSRTL